MQKRHPIVRRAYDIEMIFMVATSKLDTMYQNEMSKPMCEKYDGKFEKWFKADPKGLEEIVTKFENIPLRKGSNAWMNRQTILEEQKRAGII